MEIDGILSHIHNTRNFGKKGTLFGCILLTQVALVPFMKGSLFAISQHVRPTWRSRVVPISVHGDGAPCISMGKAGSKSHVLTSPKGRRSRLGCIVWEFLSTSRSQNPCICIAFHNLFDKNGKVALRNFNTPHRDPARLLLNSPGLKNLISSSLFIVFLQKWEGGRADP